MARAARSVIPLDNPSMQNENPTMNIRFPSPFRLVSIATACLAVLLLSGCGAGRDVGKSFQAPQNGELAFSASIKRADAKWFIADIVLENMGEKGIDVARGATNLTLEAAGQPPTTPVQSNFAITPFGVIVSTAQPTQTVSLGKGQRTVFEVKWRFTTEPSPSKNYPWKIRMSGISIDSKPIPDPIITSTAAAGQ